MSTGLRYLPAAAAACLAASVILASCGSATSTPAQGGGTGMPAKQQAAMPALVKDPSSLVNVFTGTGTAEGVAPKWGTIDETPDAALPFGMIEWGPDTTGTPGGPIPGGYDPAATSLSGFSLTHLPGAGAVIGEDVPILPVIGPVGDGPGFTSDGFDPSSASAAPGRYSVDVTSTGSAAGTAAGPIRVRLAVTERTGIAEIAFPPTAHADILVKAGEPAGGGPVGLGSAGAFHVVSPSEVTGWSEAGGFAGSDEVYRLYYAMEFAKPFQSTGTWTGLGISGAGLSPGSRNCSGPTCGGWVSFDDPSGRPIVFKVGISYVSVAGALANIQAEDPGWSLDSVVKQATASWNSVLSRIQVEGGSTAEEKSFYSALYHCLLAPELFSDADGRYAGFVTPGGQSTGIHVARHGAQYTDFSGWDVYRDEMPLLAMLVPRRASAMAQSLVRDARQGGWLPKWPYDNGYTGTMDGDSADPIIADLYAFGARSFDTAAALRQMLKGATEIPATQHLLDALPGASTSIRYLERPGLGAYESRGYVPSTSFRQSGSESTNGASTTLEYATDDAAIAFFARSLGRAALANRFLARSQSWENLFNPATGFIQPRGNSGAFPYGPVMEPVGQLPGYQPGVVNGILPGQAGFQEGNVYQYTWLVPFDLASLVQAMGGRHEAASRLDAFFAELNAGPDRPYYWAGNEPDLEVPWVYDYIGEPYRTEAVARSVIDTLYSATPEGEPGNDDLGAMSSWYVWAAIGLYPETPGLAALVVGSPLFPDIYVRTPGGGLLHISAEGAAPSKPYVKSLSLNGKSWDRAWVPLASLYPSPDLGMPGSPSFPVPKRGAASGEDIANLDFTLASTPDRSFAAAPSDAPPSYGFGSSPVIGYSEPYGRVVIPAGSSSSMLVGAENIASRRMAVHFRVLPNPDVSATPANGVLDVPPDGRFAATVELRASRPGVCVPLDIQLTATRARSSQHDVKPPPPVVVYVATATGKGVASASRVAAGCGHRAGP